MKQNENQNEEKTRSIRSRKRNEGGGYKLNLIICRQISYISLFWQINLCGCLFMGALSILLFQDHSPPLYHAYTTMTVFLWPRIINEYWSIRALWIYLCGRKFNYIIKLVATSAVALFILELLVWISNILFIDLF